MVVKHSPRGLIATTRAQATPPLEDVAASCGWPLLLEASPRRMHHELAVQNPECLLFWLDEMQAVVPTANLIAWSRHRGARPYRVAVAYRMADDVESVLRAAGAHSFLTMTGQSATLVVAALKLLLYESDRNTYPAAITAFTPSAVEHATKLRLPAEPARPP